MKFFHLSDLHIGLRLVNRDLSEDQRHILEQIVELARREQPDAVVVAGDIYDKPVPPAEAVALFDGFITHLAEAAPACEIMLISGNHDSAARLNLFRQVLSRQRVHMIGLPPQSPEEHIARVTLRDAWGPVNFLLLPFVKPSMVKPITGTDENGNNLSYDAALRRLLDREQIDHAQRNVLVSHQFYVPAGADAGQIAREDSEIVTVGNVDQVSAEVLSPFDDAALGHLHRPMTVGDETRRYCGTPLACSVSEAGQRKGVVCVELGPKGDVRTEVLPLEPLRQVRLIRGALEEVLQQACGDYVTVCLTDDVDLDVIDMRDRLNAAFPHLLEIRREALRGADYGAQVTVEAELNPYELCSAFLGDLDEGEQALLTDVINAAREVH